MLIDKMCKYLLMQMLANVKTVLHIYGGNAYPFSSNIVILPGSFFLYCFLKANTKGKCVLNIVYAICTGH